MSYSWLYYWSKDRCEHARQEQAEGKPVDYLFGGAGPTVPSAFEDGVREGDTVFVVARQQSSLLLLSRVRIHRVMPLSAWALGDEAGLEAQAMVALSGLDAHAAFQHWVNIHRKQHLIWDSNTDVAEGIGTPLRFDILIPPHVLAKMRLISPRYQKEMLPTGVEEGRLKSSSFLQNRYRCITSETAFAFNLIVDAALAGAVSAQGCPGSGT